MSTEEQRPSESAEDVADESEPQVHFEPLVQLEEVEVRTHEEDEDILYSQRARLFRFDPPTSEWKERGTGDVRLLKHRETGLTRVLMRREKTLKVCLNHLVLPTIVLERHIGSDRAWVWTAEDFSEGVRVEIFAIRFRSSEVAGAFNEQFEKAKKDMEAALEARAAADKEKPSDKDEDKKDGETRSVADAGGTAVADASATGAEVVAVAGVVDEGPSDEK